MKVTIDVSMYPNRKDFIPPIDGFIEKINCYKDLKVVTHPTSTVVQGEFDYAMNAVQDLQFRDHRDIDYRCSDSFGDGPCSCSRVELFDPARGRTHADMVCDCLYHGWRIHRDFPW